MSIFDYTRKNFQSNLVVVLQTVVKGERMKGYSSDSLTSITSPRGLVFFCPLGPALPFVSSQTCNKSCVEMRGQISVLSCGNGINSFSLNRIIRKTSLSVTLKKY